MIASVIFRPNGIQGLDKETAKSFLENNPSIPLPHDPLKWRNAGGMETFGGSPDTQAEYYTIENPENAIFDNLFSQMQSAPIYAFHLPRNLPDGWNQLGAGEPSVWPTANKLNSLFQLFLYSTWTIDLGGVEATLKSTVNGKAVTKLVDALAKYASQNSNAEVRPGCILTTFEGENTIDPKEGEPSVFAKLSFPGLYQSYPVNPPFALYDSYSINGGAWERSGESIPLQVAGSGEIAQSGLIYSPIQFYAEYLSYDPSLTWQVQTLLDPYQVVSGFAEIGALQIKGTGISKKLYANPYFLGKAPSTLTLVPGEPMIFQSKD